MPQFTTDELRASAPGSAEQSTTANAAGYYVHPETGAVAIAVYHPKFGSPQADGFVRLGYVWMRDATAEEIAGPQFGNMSPIGHVVQDAQSQGVTTRVDGVPRAQFEDLAAMVTRQEAEIERLKTISSGQPATIANPVVTSTSDGASQNVMTGNADIEAGEDTQAATDAQAHNDAVAQAEADAEAAKAKADADAAAAAAASTQA